MADEFKIDCTKEEYPDFVVFDKLKNACLDDFSKIFEIIKIRHVQSEIEANILIDFLTDCSNPLREACAFKLAEICTNDYKYFLNDFSKQKILKAVTDINPNVSRAVCSIFSNVKEIGKYVEYDLILMINSLLNNIKIYENKNNDFFIGNKRNTKNHAKNKKLFALYWCLEALFFCWSGKYNSEVLEILYSTINFNDFTIREKTAQLLNRIDNPPCDLLQKAKDDQNFYVKIQVYDKMTLRLVKQE